MKNIPRNGTDDERNALLELSRLRKSIDNFDSAIIHILAERFKCTQLIGVLKAHNDIPAYDKVREEQQITRLRVLANDAQLDADFAERIVNFIAKEVIHCHVKVAK